MRLKLKFGSPRFGLPSLQWAFLLGATICLGLSAAIWLEGTYYQARLQHEFEEALRNPSRVGVEAVKMKVTARAQPGSEFDRPPDEPVSQPSAETLRLVGQLESARIGLSVMVLEGVDSKTLRRGAGRVPGTAQPGEPGNIAIAAHRDTFFRPLRQIAVGDELLLTTQSLRERYRVEWTAVVEPSYVEVLDPTAQAALTLVTCYPFEFVGRAPKRFVVRALAVDPPDSGTQELRNGGE